MYASDCLSRASVTDAQPTILEGAAEEYANAVLSNLPCTDARLEMIKDQQHNDEICIQLMRYTQNGWPLKADIPNILMPYYQFRDYFSICNGVLLKSDRLVIPVCMRLDVLDLIHTGHLGIEKCRQRAIRGVWWPGLSKQIEEMVKNCRTCAREQPDHAEPLQTTPLPDRPWQRAAADICEVKGHTFLVVVDYYSRYIEMARLDSNTRASTVIAHLKSILATHGIVETLVTDNGPQFANAAMAKFSREYGFTHITSSPKYARSNGAAENAVKRFKNMAKKNDDLYLALLAYRATPLHNGYSPAELCMGRRLRTNLPVAPHTLHPQASMSIEKKEEKYRQNMEKNYNARHNARTLTTISPGDNVYIKDLKTEGTVIKSADNAPRSHVIGTDKTEIRRNRRHLNKLPPENDTRQPEENTHVPEAPLPEGYQTRSGRLSKPPQRLEINPHSKTYD